MGYIKVPKSSKIFYCEKCDFKCSRKSQYDRHINTLKHQNGDKMVTNRLHGDKLPILSPFCHHEEKYTVTKNNEANFKSFSLN